MMSKISDALSKLDPTNDNHWTQDGLPRLDTIKILSGDPSLTREAVTAEAPDFNREAAQAAAQGAGSAAGTPAQGSTEPAPPAPAQAAAGAEDTPPPAPPEETLPNLNPAPLAMEAGDQEELLSKINEAVLNLSERQAAVELAKQELDDAQNELARLQSQLREDPKINGNPIAEYLQRQQKNLEERAARKQLIAESGLSLKELARDLKSPLDAAMQRKNGRGGQRPTRS